MRCEVIRPWANPIPQISTESSSTGLRTFSGSNSTPWTEAGLGQRATLEEVNAAHPSTATGTSPPGTRSYSSHFSAELGETLAHLTLMGSQFDPPDPWVPISPDEETDATEDSDFPKPPWARLATNYRKSGQPRPGRCSPPRKRLSRPGLG